MGYVNTVTTPPIEIEPTGANRWMVNDESNGRYSKSTRTMGMERWWGRKYDYDPSSQSTDYLPSGEIWSSNTNRRNWF